MSAVFGIYNLNGKPVELSLLEQMSDTLAHRGMDDKGIWSKTVVALGQRMLWTTPESLHEKLPLLSNESSAVIICDARLDNRDELIPQLFSLKKPVNEISDSEIILKAYENWGEDCLLKFLGDFAFVIWDERQKRLFCARDHFGVKPFYYYASENCFAFASEIKALFQLAEVSRDLNEDMIADYLTGNFENKSATFYQKVMRLPPAHYLMVGPRETRRHCYYSLDPERESPSLSNEAFSEGLHEIFTESVRCRMRSAMPLGSKLSGGLDSTSIACVARNLLKKQGEELLPTFSLIYDRVKECDERYYINLVLSQGGFDPHFTPGDDHTPLTNLQAICRHLDRPALGPSGGQMWQLYKTISDAGVRIIFDGHDGDSAVSHGYKYLDELAQSNRWLSLAIEAKELEPISSLSRWTVVRKYVKKYRWNPFLQKHPALKKVEYIGRRLLGRNSLPSWAEIQSDMHNAVINKDFAKRINITDRYNSSLDKSSDNLQNTRKDHYQQVTSGLQVFALEELNAASAAFGIEVRYPFWDKRLIEYCLSLPGEQKLHRGWNRIVMRRAMSNVLPPEVCWRREKTDFAKNFIDGLVYHEQEQLKHLLTGDNDTLHEFFDRSAMREMYQKFSSQELKSDDLETRSTLLLFWKIASFSSWLKQTSAL